MLDFGIADVAYCDFGREVQLLLRCGCVIIADAESDRCSIQSGSLCPQGPHESAADDLGARLRCRVFAVELLG